MKITKFLAVASMSVLLLLGACSKENALKKRLDATWNYDKIDGTIASSGGGATTPFTFINAGSITLKKDGTGSYTQVLNGSTSNGTFTWTNTATTVTIIESGQPALVFTVTTNEKKKQIWTTTYTDSGDQITETWTMSLK